MQLDQVRLLVADFDATFRFYRDVLGLPVRSGAAGEVYAAFDAGGGGTVALFARSLMAAVAGTSALPATAPAQDSAMLIFAVDDLEATCARLRAAGIPLLTEPEDRPDWGIRTAHLRDPDGRLLEVFTPLE